jgi:hypothetical protein
VFVSGIAMQPTATAPPPYANIEKRKVLKSMNSAIVKILCFHFSHNIDRRSPSPMKLFVAVGRYREFGHTNIKRDLLSVMLSVLTAVARKKQEFTP